MEGVPTSPFFQPFRHDRLDKPHPTADHDPWRSDMLFPEVFTRRKWCRWLVGFLPTPGFGSYLPHLYLPLAAEFFFRSWPYVILGVILWSVLVELPIFLILYWYDLAPAHQRLWRTVKVLEKKKPSDAEIQKALKLKGQYEHPSQHEYYAVWVTTKNTTGEGLSTIPGGDINTTTMDMTNDGGEEGTGSGKPREHSTLLGGSPRPYQIFGFWYIRLDISWYVLFSILIDVVLGFVGVTVALYVIRTFNIDPFSTVIDGHLAAQFTLLFLIVAHFAEYWSWLFTLAASVYIILIRFWSAATPNGGSTSSTADWVPNLVLFGITLFYWLVFFRNPFPCVGWVKRKRATQYQERQQIQQDVGNVGRSPLDIDVLIPEDDGTGGEAGITSQPLMEVYKGQYYQWGDSGGGDYNEKEGKQVRRRAIERLRAMRTTDPSMFYPKEYESYERDGYLRNRQQELGMVGTKHRTFTVHYKAYQRRMDRVRGVRGGETAKSSVFSWWRFSSMNYDTYGYNAIFGTVILFNVVAIVALAIGS